MCRRISVHWWLLIPVHIVDNFITVILRQLVLAEVKISSVFHSTTCLNISTKIIENSSECVQLVLVVKQELAIPKYATHVSRKKKCCDLSSLIHIFCFQE
jgi:hypothetical protein